MNHLICIIIVIVFLPLNITSFLGSSCFGIFPHVLVLSLLRTCDCSRRKESRSLPFVTPVRSDRYYYPVGEIFSSIIIFFHFVIFFCLENNKPFVRDRSDDHFWFEFEFPGTDSLSIRMRPVVEFLVFMFTGRSGYFLHIPPYQM